MTLDTPHRRRNLLTGDWVLVSPHRSKRPWQGEHSEASNQRGAAYDPACYLCPGNSRMGGHTNPAYDGAFVFPNDFPALLPDRHEAIPSHNLFQTQAVSGEAQVICYSPDHSASLATLDVPARRKVVDGWCDLSADLGARWHHVQIFENRGAMMGASSPHPHGQVWASDYVPVLVAAEDSAQRAHAASHAGALLDAVADAERAAGERVIAANDHWLLVVPHWATWPFETLLIARGNIARLEQLAGPARDALADILGRLLRGYDALFNCAFPYSMGWHGAPHGLGEDCDHWRLHAHFHPPLLRSATVRKHMVGFELLAEAQRDLTPEAAAMRLKECIR